MKQSFRALALSLAILAPTSAQAENNPSRIIEVEHECVVMVHGLGRGDNSFMVLREVLTAVGYNVIALDYPSRDGSIADLLTYLEDAVAECGEDRLNFVTHSLGGILVRGYIGLARPETLGRVVMLGPPNQGSELVDKMGDLALYRFLTGPAGLELGTGPEGIGTRFGPVDFELGVIAGNLSFNPLFSAMIPGDDDGKVSVEKTRIQGMNDHIVLPVTHTFMMNNPLVIAQTVMFLNNGRFDHELTYLEMMRRLSER